MKTVLNNRSYIAEIENELIYKDYDQDSGRNYDDSFIKSKITFRKYFSKRNNLKQTNFELLSGFGYTNYRDQSSLPVFDSQFLFGSSHALFSNSTALDDLPEPFEYRMPESQIHRNSIGRTTGR